MLKPKLCKYRVCCFISQQPGVPCVYVIDEVGKMEMFSDSFVREVRDLLENPSTTVLTTIPVAKGKPIPFVEEIRHRKDAILYQVINLK